MVHWVGQRLTGHCMWLPALLRSGGDPAPKSFVLLASNPDLESGETEWVVKDSARHSPFLLFNSIHLWLVLLYLDGKLKDFHLRVVIRCLSEERDQFCGYTL